MKLQKLIIHNIASIEDAVIDFEAKPLADSEVFLITGKTGSGKSTILDAICLALYADTPRLDGTKMQGITKDGDKSVQIDDPRQLMRRNTAEAYAKLYFTGSNGVKYEASWSVSRARRKVHGNIQSKEWRLCKLDSCLVLTKDAEIKEEIKSAIGLDFGQFCRTTMLAQGEFTRFLNSEDNEKAAILEKITGVDVYSKIGAKVYSVTNEKKSRWEQAKQLTEGIETLDEDKIMQKTSTLTALGAQLSDLKSSKKKAEAKLEWITKEAEIGSAILAATLELERAKEEISSEEFKEQEALVREWNDTIDARQCLRDIQNAEALQTEVNDRLTRASSEFSELLGAQKFAREKLEESRSISRNIKSALLKVKDKVPVYDEHQTIIGLLGTISQGRQDVSRNRKLITEEEQKLAQELTPAYYEAKKNRDTALEEFNAEEQEVNKLETERDSLNLNGLRDQKEQQEELRRNIAAAGERISAYEEAKDNHALASKDLESWEKRIKIMGDELEQMFAPLHDAELKKNTLWEELTRQSKTIDDYAKTLRAELKQGETCPVCGQKIECELPHEEALAKILSDMKSSYQAAADDYNILFEKKNKLEADIKAESRRYADTLKRHNEDCSVSDALLKATLACRLCGLEGLDEKTPSSLSSLDSTVSKALETLAAMIEAGVAKETAARAARAALEKKRHTIASLQEILDKVTDEIRQCKASIEVKNSLIISKNKEIDTATEKVKDLLGDTIWELDWKTSPEEFSQDLKLQASCYRKEVEKDKSLNSEISIQENACNNVNSIIEDICNAMPEWKGIQPAVERKVKDPPSKAREIENSVNSALMQLDSARQSLNSNRLRIKDFLDVTPSISAERLVELDRHSQEEIKLADSRIKSATGEVAVKESLLRNAETQKQEHLALRPEIDESESTEHISGQIADCDRMISENEQQIGAIKQELKSDEENKMKLGTLIEDANSKKAEYDKWFRINQLIGDQTGAKFRKIAQSYVLSSLIHSANGYMKTLTDRYTLKVVPGTFVISLEDAYQGFASRAASTISGGESFLVSLSLALALSDIGHTLSVDTLFIDEGFGTLSGEPLQNAINTLRSLHSKAGRHVGIISHVEELQERIPVQIQVIQEGNSSSSTIKVIPE